MREILFRGKRIDNGEWVEGGYVKREDGREYIIVWISGVNKNSKIANMTDTGYEVIPETVGQYTGLTDVNGNKIFEGDIVRLHYFFENINPTTLGAFEDETEIMCIIDWYQFGWEFYADDNNFGYLSDYIQEVEEEVEVIGNVHDAPELLKEGE